MITRRLTEADRELLRDWIARDPYHADRVDVEFFYTDDALTLAFEDEIGPVCYVKLQPDGGAVRVHIQFDTGNNLRTARMLKQGFPIVKHNAEMAKASKLIFDSVHQPLIEFCKNRFGFHAIPGTEDLELLLGT